MTMRATMDELDDDERQRLEQGATDYEPDESTIDLPEVDLSGPEEEPVRLYDESHVTEARAEPKVAGALKVDAEPDAVAWGESGDAVKAPPPGPSKYDMERDELKEAMRRIASREYKPVAGADNSAAIAKAKAERREQIQRNDFTRAIQAALLRKPFNPTDPDEIDVKAVPDGRREFERKQDRDLSMQKALLGSLEKPQRQQAPAGGLTEYQRIQVARQQRLDNAKAKKDAEGGGGGGDQAWRDGIEASGMYDDVVARLKKAGKWDSIGQKEGKDLLRGVESDRGRKASIAAAREGRAFTRTEGDEKDVKELANKLGDPAAFNQQYGELMKLVKENGGEVPGLGFTEGVKQQSGILGAGARAISPSNPAAIKGRKLLRQLGAGYAHEISGAGVSDRERANLEAATIDVNNDDSAIALSGLQTLREMHDAKIAQIKRGYKPEVVKKAVGPETPAPAPGGTVKMKFPDGSTHDVTPDKLEKAKAKGAVPVNG